MLVLSRRIDQRITLELPGGGIVEIALVRIGEQQAKIGVTAPDDVIIVRSELYGEEGSRAKQLDT